MSISLSIVQGKLNWIEAPRHWTQPATPKCLPIVIWTFDRSKNSTANTWIIWWFSYCVSYLPSIRSTSRRTSGWTWWFGNYWDLINWMGEVRNWFEEDQSKSIYNGKWFNYLNNFSTLTILFINFPFAMNFPATLLGRSLNLRPFNRNVNTQLPHWWDDRHWRAVFFFFNVLKMEPLLYQLPFELSAGPTASPIQQPP